MQDVHSDSAAGPSRAAAAQPGTVHSGSSSRGESSSAYLSAQESASLGSSPVASGLAEQVKSLSVFILELTQTASLAAPMPKLGLRVPSIGAPAVLITHQLSGDCCTLGKASRHGCQPALTADAAAWHKLSCQARWWSQAGAHAPEGRLCKPSSVSRPCDACTSCLPCSWLALSSPSGCQGVLAADHNSQPGLAQALDHERPRTPNPCVYVHPGVCLAAHGRPVAVEHVAAPACEGAGDAQTTVHLHDMGRLLMSGRKDAEGLSEDVRRPFRPSAAAGCPAAQRALSPLHEPLAAALAQLR